MIILNILKRFFNVSFQTKYFWLRQSAQFLPQFTSKLFYNNLLHLKREWWLTLSVQANIFNPRAKPRWEGRLCCSQLSYIWDLWCDHSHLWWVSIQHLLLPYWTVNISDQQLKSRCVCVMSSMHSTWNDLSLKTELWMHSRLQQYPEMFFLHSRVFVGEFSTWVQSPWHSGQEACADGDSFHSQCNSWKERTNHHHILHHYFSIIFKFLI